MRKRLISEISFVLMAVLLVLAVLPLSPARAAVTRFYLQNATSSVTTSDQGTWNYTTGVPTLVMSRTKSGTITSRAVPEAVITNPYDVMILKFVSEPIPAQTISGTLTWVIGALEDAGSANDFYKIHAYVVSNDGATLRGTLLSNNVDTSEWPTAAQGQAPAAAKTLSEVTAQVNDRIVIEIGYDAQNSQAVERIGTLWYGGTGSDLTAGGDETTLTGWFEFSELIPDTTAPTVDSFTVTTPSNSLAIPITAFTASDNLAVTGYMVTTTPTPPLANDLGWAPSAPTTYTVLLNGSYTLYPWAKDAAGNVSSVFSTPPTVSVDYRLTIYLPLIFR